jgi:hypothetical protein
MISVVALLLVPFYLTIPVRRMHTGWLFGVTIFLVAACAAIFIGARVCPPTRQNRWIEGRPLFGDDAGGAPVRLYRTSLSAAAAVKVDFDEADRHALGAYNSFVATLVQKGLRFAYETRNMKEPRDPLSDDDWEQLWTNSYLPSGRVYLKDRDLYFKNAVGDLQLQYDMITGRLNGGRVIVNSFAVVLELAALVLAARHLDGHLALLTLIQCAAVIAFIAATLSALYHVLQRDSIRFDRRALALFPPDVVAELSEEQISAVEALELHPSKIQVESQYRKCVRNYYCSRCLFYGVVETVSLTMLALVVLLVGTVWGLDPDGDSAEWTIRLLATVGGMLVGYVFFLYCTFLAVHQANVLVFTLVTGLFMAVAPTLLNYLVSGDADLSGISAAVTATVGGVSAAIVGTIVNSRKQESAVRS